VLWQRLLNDIFHVRQVQAAADPASKLGRGAISVIFGSQVSLRIHCRKRNEGYFTPLL